MFAVIVNWHSPFAIVILEQHRIIHAGPGAPLMCQGCTVHKSDRLPRSLRPSLCVVAIGKVNLPARRGLCIATVTTSRRACRAPRATESRSRCPVGVRDPTELGFAAALQAKSAWSERR